MSAEPKPRNAAQAAINFWDFDRASLKEGMTRPVSTADIDYIGRQHAYLQIVGSTDERPLRAGDDSIDLNAKDFGEPVPITVRTGWVVQYWPPLGDYPAAMSTSPAATWLGGSMDLDFVWEGYEHEPGTIIKQAFDTAGEMVLIAKHQGWKDVQIVVGHEILQWPIWAVAEAHGMECHGFEPTPQHLAKRDRVADIIEAQFMPEMDNLGANVPTLGAFSAGSSDSGEEG